MMNNPNTLLKAQKGRLSQHDGGLDPQVILSLIVKNWYYFLIALVGALICARLYISHTMPVYRVSTTVLINEASERQSGNNDQLLQGLGLPGGMRNLENQIMILRSRGITEKTLKELPFEVEYYSKGLKNQVAIYPEIPIKIISNNEIPLPMDIEFSFQYLGDQGFILKSESESFSFYKQASFGETIEAPGGTFHIELRNEKWFNLNKGKELYLIIYSKFSLINNFNSRLNVSFLEGAGSILILSMEGTNRAKDVDFVNKLVEVFQSVSLERKNTEAVRRIQFIDDQLVGISDSLSLTENKLQQFRSNNRIMDVSAQGQAIIAQVTLLENERARLSLEANYYDYLSDYLDKDISKEVPIVPITMGISDQGLTRLVTELSEQQQQLLNSGAGEMNPLQGLLTQRIRSTKGALLETLNGLRRANSLARSENEDQINRVNKQAATLPFTERQLLGIERKFRLNNELYTFLLEMRSEQLMQKASNMADCEVIDPAAENVSGTISPNRSKITFIALFAGFVIPFIIIFLNYIFNKKLSVEDIKKITELPIAGNIPHSLGKSNIEVFDNLNSGISEAFRLLRSKLQFFTKEAKSPIILITSAIAGEGKSFTAINLGSVYSLLGKKTIIVGFDLRKPRIYQDFNLSNEKGVSTWLIGRDKLEDIIQKTAFENLSVIPAGPIPPNPSELIELEKTSELLRLLKESYDYIVIDSSPIGVISDTIHLAALADAFLLVVRPGLTLRDMLENTLEEINSSERKGVCLVINDIPLDYRQYLYGERHGYTTGKKSSKWGLLKRRKLFSGK